MAENDFYLKRFNISVSAVKKWFEKLGNEFPEELKSENVVELIEIPLSDEKSVVVNPFFICEMNKHKVVKIVPHMETLKQLTPKYTEQHNPTYTFNSKFYEMSRGLMYQREVFPSNNNDDPVFEKEEARMLVANRVIRILRKDFIRIEDPKEGGPTHRWKIGQIPIELFTQLIDCLNEVLNTEPMIVPISPPAFVIGDLSGSYDDVTRIMSALQIVPTGTFGPCAVVLVGDYIPFGPHPLEVFAMIAAMKILCSKNFVLLSPQYPLNNLPNEMKPCFEIIKKKIVDEYGDDKLYAKITQSISNFGLAALIDGKILCVHIGLPVNVALSSDMVAEMKKISKRTYEPPVQIVEEGDEMHPTEFLPEDLVIRNTKCNFIIRGGKSCSQFLSKHKHMIFLKSNCLNEPSKRNAGVLVDKGKIRVLIVSKHFNGLDSDVMSSESC
ncbi:protein phosphatase 2A, caeel, putative [Entamoeba invadens IP1]|uniref:protein-serine/threonine phosphatase n=1 Tax=Entamoeba invadens IP1 TaxID=370355 RepID=A0A0A1UCW9_ENTIV|nr:protein phosphatase 2A, caeel, putative [Entamoeba invadens IP1]ELP93681.1 protein phosphatase 2A, caeel, putative [Entamoeba invadens IP1]|eukprot:XP_004260452.1 protein phosphatase 2A, caeel, putative [Entamoeba invadens IP1]